MSVNQIPLVSVILCNYNYETYIEQSIDSILGQSYDNFELIIVDDGSSDHSVDIISGYSDSRVRKIFQENGGQAAAFNAGFSAASGEYIAFIDSDDYWEPEKLTVVIDEFIKLPDLSLVQHPLEIIEKSGKTGRFHPPGLLYGVHDILIEYISSNFTGYFSATSGLTMPKKCLDKIFPINADWRICADVAITRPLPLFGKILTIKDTLGYYRVHDENFWMNSKEQEKLYENQIRYTDYTNRWLETLGYEERIDFNLSDIYKDSKQHKFHPERLFRKIKNIFNNFLLRR